MYQYAFQLGTNPALSYAEVVSVLNEGVSYDSGIAYYNGGLVDAQGLLDRLGGTIRIIEIIDEFQTAEDTENIVFDRLNTMPTGSKTSFSIGYANVDAPHNVKKSAMHIKKELKKNDVKTRFVDTHHENILSPASAFHNKLHLTQTEFVVMRNIDRYYIGKTIAIQNPDAYSFRDEKRPYRDARLGMMPVKLVQILLNLAKIGPSCAVLDPFCGLGTTLQESLLLGAKAFGSDVQENVAEKAKKNLSWAVTELNPPSNIFQIATADAAVVSETWGGKTFDGVVTEGYLGTPLKAEPSMEQIDANFDALEKVYLSFFKSLKGGLLKPNARVVVTMPFYILKEVNAYAPWVDKIRSLGYTDVNILGERAVPGYNPSRNAFEYARPDARVGREIRIWTLAQ